MRLNIYNNFRAIYYNTLANFYLCFNSVVPYYDDVILSLSITSFKNILNNNNLCLRAIKQNRLVQLLYSLNDKDNLILDDDGFIIIDYNDVVYTENAEFSDNTDTENDVDNADAVSDVRHARHRYKSTCFTGTEVQILTQGVVLRSTFQDAVENTEGIVENTEGIVKNTEGIVKNTKGIVKNTKGIVKNTEGIVKNTEGIVKNTEGIVENTDEGDTEVKFNILDKKNN